MTVVCGKRDSPQIACTQRSSRRITSDTTCPTIAKIVHKKILPSLMTHTIQIGGHGLKEDDISIGGDVSPQAILICLHPSRPDIYTAGLICKTVANKNVRLSVLI